MIQMHGYGPCPTCGAGSLWCGAHSESDGLFSTFWVRLKCQNGHYWTVPAEFEP